MRWNDLDKVWQRVFELSWISFCEGNLPIAAVIADMEGNILSAGRNHYHISSRFLNPEVDHAETECIQTLDIKKYPNVREYILYTNMEPCPMCMGTIAMGSIRKVRIASKDGWAGATDLCFGNDYMINKHMDIQFMDHIYGVASMVFQLYAELKYRGRDDHPVTRKFKKDYPNAFHIARILYEVKALDRYMDQKTPYEEIFDTVCSMIKSS